MHTITKRYSEFPAAHRQHKHQGHCAMIHGHSWSFEFKFTCEVLDENEFVIDFGRMKFLREYLQRKFDHTLLLNEDDPQLQRLRNALSDEADIVVVPNCGAEGLAEFLFDEVENLFLQFAQEDAYIEERLEARLTLVSVTVFEDSNNSATFTPDDE